MFGDKTLLITKTNFIIIADKDEKKTNNEKDC